MISFCKMQATGNDFVIINCVEEEFRFSYSNLAKYLCNRKFGIGADGVIFLNYADKLNCAKNFEMRIFNSDGSEAEMCGNGIRCLAKYIYEKGLCNEKKLCINTLAGTKNIELIVENKTVIGIKVDMGSPIYEYSKIPVIFPNVMSKKLESISVKIDNEEYELYVISMGNPHAVCFVENLDKIDIEKVGPIIENYKYFPKKTNVEFVQVLAKNRIKLKVWERGVGVTLGCGTGACAATVISTLKKSTDSELTVDLDGGKLKISYNKNLNKIKLIGTADTVFEGKIDI